MSRELGSAGPFDDDKRGAPAGWLYCQSQGNIEARGNVTVKDLLLDHVESTGKTENLKRMTKSKFSVQTIGHTIFHTQRKSFVGLLFHE